MPVLHVVCCGEAMDFGTRIRSTISKGVMESSTWDRPLWGFDMPMDELTREPGLAECTCDELLAELSAKQHWWLARIYANYDNDLDMYIKFSYAPGMVYHFVLKVPMQAYAGLGPLWACH